MARKRQTEPTEPHPDQQVLPGFAVVQNPRTGQREVVLDPTGMFELVDMDDDQGEEGER